LGKAPDLLLRVDAVQHGAFLHALKEYGMSFNGNDLTIPHNTLVGIEVECASEPDSTLTRSIENNLTKDRTAGLTHIVFAVMPTSVRRAADFLRTHHENLDGIYVIDALRLLAALRKDPSHG